MPGSTTTRVGERLALSTHAVLPSEGRRTSAPRSWFSPLDGWPTHSPVYASHRSSRTATHELGGWCGSLNLHRKGLAPSTSCRSRGAPVHSNMTAPDRLARTLIKTLANGRPHMTEPERARQFDRERVRPRYLSTYSPGRSGSHGGRCRVLEKGVQLAWVSIRWPISPHSRHQFTSPPRGC